jgi:hypothetical protein
MTGAVRTTWNSPNTDRSLLTTAELRTAIGLADTDTSKDATLVPLGNYVSAMITAACKVAKSGIIPPTLREETVTETFLFKSLQRSLVLSRRPVSAVASVTESNSLLADTEYTLDGASGILYRSNLRCRYTMPNGPWGWWPCGNTVVQYTAGYATVPDDLKYAAIKFVQAENTTGSRDPNLKSLRIEGVSERTWWVSDKQAASVVPSEVMDILTLGGYANVAFA